LLVQLEEAREQAAGLARELAQAMERAGRAEGRADALQQQVAAQADMLTAERAHVDRLEAALAEARRGWVERLIAVWRRR
jgi:predicted  nucleic acid-binding Zn-ribbon protein